MKIFEVEFVYDDWDTAKNANVGSQKNPFRVRIPFPKDVKYSQRFWSDNHSVIRKIFQKKYNPEIRSDSYERRYWIHAIRRVS
tara:strand:+ start:219 stop:467 length:249 start_codon:yes stop_codon:yes gene_type:complete